MTRPLLLALVLLAGCAPAALVVPPAPAAGDEGVMTFATPGGLARSTDGRSFVTGAPATLSGELRFPAGSGPFPAVVLAHGCNGNASMERSWGAALREAGYATFVLDSFRSRGINEVCTNGRTLVPLQRVPDAYGALRLLAAHPRIDARRVVLMGFSHGGALAMLAATEWARERYAPEGQPAFRAFVPFYPNCNAEFPERRRVSAPVRIHTGAADDWTPAAPCAALAKALQAAGQDVAIRVYPGAHHAFDVPGLMQNYRPRVNNGGHCFPRLASILGPLLEGNPGCMKTGATVGGHPAAAAEARKLVREQLDELTRSR